MTCLDITEQQSETSVSECENNRSGVAKCKVNTANGIHTAVEVCDELKAAVTGKFIHDDFNQIVTNLKGGYGNRIYIKSGKYSGGVCLRYCPFCGGKLMSDEEADMVQHQVEMELARHSQTSI